MESNNVDQNIIDKSMRSVFVGNIPYEATEEKLKDIFSEVGPVLSFKLVFDRESGKPKGYGFCEYKDQETALSAMRNLNNYEIAGRVLRVDNACTEKSRMEMQNLLNAPPVENPYGDPTPPEKAPEVISKAVASLPPEQMFELMSQMKLCIQNNPTEARQMLLQNPQLAYALLQAQVVMRIIDPNVAKGMLHKQQPPLSPLQPGDTPILGQVPINVPTQVGPVPAPVPPPRSEFPMGQPMTNQNPVFSAQDVDLRSLDARPPPPIDPRLARNVGIGDQDMRQVPTAGPMMNNFSGDVFNRDPRAQNPPAPVPAPFSDPRTAARNSVDPRQAKTTIPQPVPPVTQNNVAPTIGSTTRPPTATVPSTTVSQLSSRVGASLVSGIGASGASDQEKAALIMQVLQLSDEQIAMLPPEQRNSILVLKEQIAKSTQR